MAFCDTCQEPSKNLTFCMYKNLVSQLTILVENIVFEAIIVKILLYATSVWVVLVNILQ